MPSKLSSFKVLYNQLKNGTFFDKEVYKAVKDFYNGNIITKKEKTKLHRKMLSYKELPPLVMTSDDDSSSSSSSSASSSSTPSSSSSSLHNPVENLKGDMSYNVGGKRKTLELEFSSAENNQKKSRIHYSDGAPFNSEDLAVHIGNQSTVEVTKVTK